MKKVVSISLLAFVLFLAACGGAAAETGTLEIRANGEDFVRQGFVSKDGWQIDFDHVYVTVSEVAAYQTDPPYDASDGEEIDGTAVTMADVMTLDLAAGDENADPILVGSDAEAAAGLYNAVEWSMVPAPSGETEGYVVVLDGTAQKDGETIDFLLQIDEPYQYRCGEFVGDERKGILAADSLADVELTFHFDHVFGDADSPMDDALNVGALGFDPLAALATDGQLVATYGELADQLSGDDFFKLADTLATLGHVGEGHCFEAEGGYTAHSE